MLVLLGDVPLCARSTLQRLIDDSVEGELALLTAVADDPTGYGRVIRDERGEVTRIVEEKDATDDERRVNEVNTGVIAFGAKELRRCLAQLDNDNSQREYYLTDVIAMAARTASRCMASSSTRRPRCSASTTARSSRSRSARCSGRTRRI